MTDTTERDSAAVTDALAAVTDPCMQASGLGISIIDMGLVNGIAVTATDVEVKLTFTEVGCPFAMRLIDEAERALQSAFPGRNIAIKPDWSPPWQPERLSAAAKKTLEQSSLRLRHLMPAAAAAERARRQAATLTNSTEH